ncbi:MAG: response regulator transcription factor [Verrucomicrobiae bacterium]|nr:response regulator transcription factor [Verrucomicrobiae bacterium]
MSTAKKILIIEDQGTMRRNLALLLEMEGFQVVTAENGRIGLETARRERPDVILCDVMMPEMDGYAVVQALRGEPDFATTPFLFLTAKGEKSDIRVGMNFGADDYLTKPVVRDDLLAAIEARLARAEAQDERVRELAGNHPGGHLPDFSSPAPLQTHLGLTGREAEVLLWVAQGKSNGDVSSILGCSEKTVKQHLGSIFEKLGVENRTSASLVAVETLAKHSRG